ncbi:2-hydroxyacyl-CoA dehydratase family protein [Sporomusa sphaeroides DSM 2875]|uniref:2-hydroxyacyl-CoA dehydratase subunit D n=1 Tax=Sporomusa sphaeroides TaxID=47679 RepID=UPI00202DCC2C|nr:2-hydroxyacyl-CoA dehydratase family protein [Sporomusa sphaeroides]MCM0759500.1 2-hydroxyacyl-CoA dehydratase family protein [Sporomusa sphaeroides DSM 2875]
MTEKMTSSQMYGLLMDKHYSEAKAAKESGRLVAWSSAIAPPEFLEVMGIHAVYPENHVAAIGAKKGAIPLMQNAEGQGYSMDTCSYARINLGYIKTQECNFREIPLPDLLFCNNNTCNTITKWYEILAKELKIPLIMLDTPFNYEYGVTKNRIDYIKAQFQQIICHLEQITKKSFDYDKFKEIMKISSEASLLWKKVADYNRLTPSPLNGFNIFNYMALSVCYRTKKESLEFFKLVSEELEQLIKAGSSQFPVPEKYRIMWDGIACWPYLSHNFKTLKKYGMNVVGSFYPYLWARIYEPGNMDSMAEAYASISMNRNLAFQVETRKNILKEFNCDGAIYHMNRSCKIMDFMQLEVQRQVHGSTGVPYITFDGDQTDPRAFSEAQFETRVQALAETMDELKQKSVGR